MTFSNLEIDEKDIAAAKFIGDARREIVRAIIERKEENKDVCQSYIAKRIGIDKGSLSRILNGSNNITLRKIAEIAWALELEPQLKFAPIHHSQHNGTPRLKIKTGNALSTTTWSGGKNVEPMVRVMVSGGPSMVTTDAS